MKRLIAIIIIIVLLLAFVAACSDGDRPPTVDELLALGEQFLLDGNYEQALVQFMQAIEIEPMNPRGYTGAAEAYVGLGDYAGAREVLEDGLLVVGDDVGISGLLEDLRRVEEERRQAEIEAEVERRLAEIEEEEANVEHDDASNIAIVPSIDLARRYLDIIEAYGPYISHWNSPEDGIHQVSFIDMTNDGISELILISVQSHLEFSVYKYSNGQVSRFIHINPYEFCPWGVGNTPRDARLEWTVSITQNMRLIVHSSLFDMGHGSSKNFVFNNLEGEVTWEMYDDALPDSFYDDRVTHWLARASPVSVEHSDAIDITMTFDEAVEFLRSNPF